jgi:hypothetical protein
MLKVLFTFCLFGSIAHAAGLEEVYWVPIYPSYTVSQKQLPILMHTLEHLPDPAYVTNQRLTREEVIFSNRNWDEARAGLQFWASRTVGNETLINTLGKLYTASNYGHKSATSDMLTLYETAIKFFTNLEPKPEVVDRFRILREDVTLENKRLDAEMNWDISKGLIPDHPSGKYSFLMVVPGGYVYPTSPLEKYRAAAGSFITRMFRRTSVSSGDSDDSRETLPLPEMHAEPTEADPLVKKKV